MTRDRAEARLLSRILRFGLLLALLAPGRLVVPARTEPAQTDQQAQGQALYEANCSTCHGLRGPRARRTAPACRTPGPAAVDFMLSTGRMPLANPGDQPVRDEPRFTARPDRRDRRLRRVDRARREPIPTVDPARGRPHPWGRGVPQQLRRVSRRRRATGDSVGGGQIAPDALPGRSPRRSARRSGSGPGVMPQVRTGDDRSEPTWTRCAAYLLWLRDNGDDGGLQLGPGRRGRRGPGHRGRRPGSHDPVPAADGSEDVKRAERTGRDLVRGGDRRRARAVRRLRPRRERTGRGCAARSWRWAAWASA